MSPPDLRPEAGAAIADPPIAPVQESDREAPVVPLPSPTVQGAALAVRVDGTVPVLRVPEALPDFEAMRAAVREQLPSHVALIAGRSIRLDLGAREVVLFDLRRLLHLLRQEFSLEVTGLYVTRPTIHRFAERELKLKLFVHDDATPAPAPETSPDDEATEPVVPADLAPAGPAVLEGVTLPHDLSPADLGDDAAPAPQETRNVSATPGPAPLREEGRRTQVIHRTLRSGNVVRFDGDLFVFGDVNPGAQIVASGNISVLGALKGMAHAGAAGDESAFILAFDLRPTQLRIGRKIAIPPDRRPGADLHPEIAQVSGDQIVLDPYPARRR